MKLIKPGLFVGTREEANNPENLKKYQINRVLTIDSQLLDEQSTAAITRFHVNCLDEPSADLLTSFDRCIQFIDEGLTNNEAVLVHW
jgi:protein-tyrosine phosphatase